MLPSLQVESDGVEKPIRFSFPLFLTRPPLGLLAGLMQLENLWGFAFYILVCVGGLTAVVWSSRENNLPLSDVATFSIFSGLFTFCLFWVLAFNFMLISSK